MIDRIRSINPDLGFPTPEHSLDEIVRRHYAAHFADDEARRLTDDYFNALERRLTGGDKPKLSMRQQQVFDVLTNAFQRPWAIAQAAGITTTSPGETAAKFCIQLVKLGLAEKGGSPMFPEWRRVSGA